MKKTNKRDLIYTAFDRSPIHLSTPGINRTMPYMKIWWLAAMGLYEIIEMAGITVSRD